MRLSYPCPAASDNCTDTYSDTKYLVQGETINDAGEILTDIWFGTGPDESDYVPAETIFHRTGSDPADDGTGCFINSLPL